MTHNTRPLVLFALLFGVTGVYADETNTASESNWLAPSLGPLTPHAHFHSAVGDSSGETAKLAASHHDPSRDDGSAQGLELGTSLGLNQLEGFATYVLTYGAEEEWDDEWEEAFLKLRDLPGGFEVRGGRMLGRFGAQNAKHLHAWNFVDMPLPLSGFLGEHGLWYEGGDVTWLSRQLYTTFGITLGYGDPVKQSHDHADEQADEYAHAQHDSHGGLEFEEGIFSSRLFAQYAADDFKKHEAGFSTVTGEEPEGREMMVFGLDYVFSWRENGLEPGGRALVWTTEFLFRGLEKGKEPLDRGDEVLAVGDEFGFYSDVVYTLNNRFDLGTRFNYIEGSEELESDEHIRISPAVTLFLDPYRRTSLRTQYNYDDLAHGEEEHTVWVQLALNWGGAEVR